MRARMQTLILMLVVGTCLVASGEVPTETPMRRADKSRAAAETRRAKPFKRAYFLSRLASANGKARSKAIEQLRSVYAGREEVPAVAMLGLTGLVRRGQLDSTATQLLQILAEYRDRDDVRDYLLELFDNEKTLRGGSFRQELVSALGQFNDDRVHQRLLSVLETDDLNLRVLAAEGLSRWRNRYALPAIIALAEDPRLLDHFGHRMRVLRSIAHYLNLDAVDFLVAELPSLDGRLKFYTIEFLTRLTGQLFGDDVGKWKEWWRAAAASFHFPDELPDGPAEIVWSRELPEFFDTKFYGKRVMFVIDISTTMRRLVNRHETRLDRAKRELIGAIDKLPADALFSIVLFNRMPLAFINSATATPANKRAAARRIRAIPSGPGTNLYGGLEMAMQLGRNFEVLFLLSDGQANRGKVVNPDEIVRAVSQENRFRQLAIHTITVGPRNRMMELLAKRNGGTHRRTH